MPELEPFDFRLVPKDCGCITHEGLHWIHHDKWWFEHNLDILRSGLNALSRYAFLQNECLRLQEKERQMRRYVSDGKRPCIFPPGCSEREYNQRTLEVLKLPKSQVQR